LEQEMLKYAYLDTGNVDRRPWRSISVVSVIACLLICVLDLILGKKTNPRKLKLQAVAEKAANWGLLFCCTCYDSL